MPRALADLPGRAFRIWSGGETVGALVVSGVHKLTRSEDRMVQDLTAQAALLLDRLTLAEAVQQERTAGHLTHLTRREREVLELMARGLSNAAICQELHLSVKPVEPLISTVFGKLGLHADSHSEPPRTRGAGVPPHFEVGSGVAALSERQRPSV